MNFRGWVILMTRGGPVSTMRAHPLYGCQRGFARWVRACVCIQVILGSRGEWPRLGQGWYEKDEKDESTYEHNGWGAFLGPAGLSTVGACLHLPKPKMLEQRR